MKEKYELTEVEVIKFQIEDVIMLSEEDELPFVPAR